MTRPDGGLGSARRDAAHLDSMSMPDPSTDPGTSQSTDATEDPLRPEPRYPESTIDYCARLPKRRWAHTAKGLLLELPRTGMVVVPYENVGGGWNAVVVVPDRRGTYQPDGYSLFIGNEEIETAIERAVGEPVNLDDRKVENPDSPFRGLAARVQARRAQEQLVTLNDAIAG